jgi:hypothetical protein
MGRWAGEAGDTIISGLSLRGVGRIVFSRTRSVCRQIEVSATNTRLVTCLLWLQFDADHR